MNLPVLIPRPPVWLAFLVPFLMLLGSVQAQDVPTVLNAPGFKLSNPSERARAVQRLQEIEVRQLSKARGVARKKGVPFRQKFPNGRIKEVAGLDENGELVFYTTHNVDAAISTGVDQVNLSPYLLDGSGLLVGVWDGGSVRSTHQEFNEGPSSRINVMDGSAADDHGTHVGGTIAAAGVGSYTKGMAPAATVDSYNWISDESEITGRAATAAGQFDTHLYLSNHSYGFTNGWDGNEWTGTGTDQNAYDIDFGQYGYKARNLDSIAYNAPYYLGFYSAGNDGSDNPSTGSTVTIGGSSVTYNPAIHPLGDGVYRGGYETIANHGVAKNLMTIGAGNDAVSFGVRDTSVGTLAGFSSTGPCDDGRIKPDLVANGVGLRSPLAGSDSDYGIYSGTSMSSPNACGSAALLVEYYRELFDESAMRASTLKGLLIHTATDVGNAGPDYKYGWGYLDAKTAADHLLEAATYPDKLSIVESQVSTSTAIQTYNFSWDGSSPIRATLSWTDPAGANKTSHDDRTPDLVNDLNLKLIAPDGTEHFPFVMPFVGTWTVASMSELATTGLNNVDNVEQVLIPSPSQTGEWTVEVSYAGTLTSGAQDFGLLVTGSSFNPAGTVAFSSDAFEIAENAGTATITVDRIGGNVGPVSVDYATSDGTALAGNDYTATSGTLTWADADSSSKTFSILIIDDTIHEDPQETVFLTLSNPSGVDISGSNPATLNINENDNQPPLVNAGSNQIVVISGSVWSPSSLSPSLWLDADDAATITLNGSTVSQWSDKSGNNRHATQGTANSQPTLTSGGLNGKDILTLDGASDYLNVDLDFMAGVDHSVFVVTETSNYTNIYGAANVNAGANSLHVGFLGDATYRMNYWGNDWTRGISANFQAGGTNLLNYVWLSGSTKEIFANGKSEGTRTGAGIVGTMSGGGRISNVTEDGYYGGTIAEFIAFDNALTLAERQELEGFLAHKWGTTSLLAVDHPYKSQSPNNASATANLDGTVSDGDNDPITLIWSMLSGPATVTFGDVNAIDTTVAFQAPGSYTLRLTADDGYDQVSDDIIVTVSDDMPGVTVSAISGDTDEGGSTATFTVVLNTEPTSNVTIGLSSSDTGEGTVSPTSLTFGTGDWNVQQTVTVTGVDDALDDGDQVYSVLTAATSSLDATYNGLNPDDVSVTNLDDDFTLSVIAGIGGESVTGGGVKDRDNSPFAISATASSGYTFANWTVTAGSATLGDPNSASTSVATGDDATVQANFGPDTYTVSYDGNGNTGGAAPADQTKTHGVDLALESNSGNLVRDGYVFAGWNTSADGSGTDYAGGAPFTVNADAILYARWLLSTPPVVSALSPADNASGTAVNASLSVTFDEEIMAGAGNVTIKNLSDASETIINITDASQISISGTVLSIHPTNELVVGKYYAVQIDAGAVTDQFGSPFAGIGDDTTWDFRTVFQLLIFSESFEDPNVIDDGETDPTGWDTDGHPNHVHISDENDAAPDFVSTPYGEQALTCYRGSGTSYATTSATILSDVVSADTNYILSFHVAALPSRPDAFYTVSLLAIDGAGGETVLGSVVGNNDGSSDMSFSDSIGVTPSTNIGERLAIRLRHTPGSSWQDKPTFDNVQLMISGGAFAVTYHGNGSDGGSVPLDATDYSENDTVTVLGNPGSLTKAGYTFAGWNTATDGSGTSYIAGNTFTISADTTLYAQWSLPPFEDWAGEASSPSEDSSGDGIADGLAWVVGASGPSSNATALMPTSDAESDPSYYIFTYRRSDEAHNDPGTNISVVYGGDMLNWSPAVHDGSDVIITETNDDYGVGVDRVEVKLSWSLFSEDKAFVRLRVDITP